MNLYLVSFLGMKSERCFVQHWDMEKIGFA